MRITSARTGLFLALLLGAGLASTPLSAADQAREAVGLFVQSCLKHVDKPEALRDWIAGIPQLRKFPGKDALAYLEGERGEVWSADNESGLYSLILLHNNICKVEALQANAEKVSQVFSEYVYRKALPLDKIGDRTEYVRGIDKREEIYRSSSGDTRYEVVLITSRSMRADAQAVLMTLPNR